MRDVNVTVKPNNAGTQVHIHFEDDKGLTHYGTIENEDVVSVYNMPSTQNAVKFLEKTISWDKPFKAIYREKYNVKNAKELKKLKESVNTTQDYSEIRQYLRQGKIVDVTDYEGEYSDIIYALCADVEEQLMDKYEDLFIEPSVQAGRGGIFAWFTRDGKQYEAEWDYEEDCEAINDFVRSNATEEGFKKAYSAYVEDKLNHAVLNENMSRKFTKRLHESRK